MKPGTSIAFIAFSLILAGSFEASVADAPQSALHSEDSVYAVFLLV